MAIHGAKRIILNENHAKNKHIEYFVTKSIQNLFGDEILIRMTKIPLAHKPPKYRYRYASASDTEASVLLSRTLPNLKRSSTEYQISLDIYYAELYQTDRFRKDFHFHDAISPRPIDGF